MNTQPGRSRSGRSWRGRGLGRRVLALGGLFGVAMTCAYFTGRVTAQNALVTPDEINTVEVQRQALPGTVRIDVRIREETLQPGESPNDTGSGFFYKSNLIVTNYHVVQNQESITVTLSDGRVVPAKIRGVDPGLDIAVLRVTGVSAPKILSFGDSSRMVPGQKTIAIGTPISYQNFISTGVYATSSDKVPRTDKLGSEVGSYMLTTATIQGGSSGGPILDSRGQVMGVADANVGASELVPGIIGVFIPGNLVKQSLADLETVGVSQRGTLGVTFQDPANLDPALRQLAGLTSSNGALIIDVPAGTAGARSGLRGSLKNNEGQLVTLGDVIVKVDKDRVKNSYDVVRRVAAKRPGQTVTLTVWRNKKEVAVKVTLLKRTLAN